MAGTVAARIYYELLAQGKSNSQMDKILNLIKIAYYERRQQIRSVNNAGDMV